MQSFLGYHEKGVLVGRTQSTDSSVNGVLDPAAGRVQECGTQG